MLFDHDTVLPFLISKSLEIILIQYKVAIRFPECLYCDVEYRILLHMGHRFRQRNDGAFFYKYGNLVVLRMYFHSSSTFCPFTGKEIIPAALRQIHASGSAILVGQGADQHALAEQILIIHHTRFPILRIIQHQCPDGRLATMAVLHKSTV